MFANFPRYTRFIARRERVISLGWIIGLVAFIAAITAAYPNLFASYDALKAMVQTVNSPGMVAMMGPVFGFPDNLNTPMVMAQQCLLWVALAAAVMNIFFVIRHTRTDEELGRHEMLASLPVGRLTGSLATLCSAFVLNLLISVISAALVILVLGHVTIQGSVPGSVAAGAFAYCLSIGAQGFAFAGITLLVAQLFSTSSGTMGVSVALLIVFYMIRAVGDMQGSALTYLSPLGLGLRVQAFYTNAFWPIIVLVAEGLVIGGIALMINAKRDVGMGVFAARKGRVHAKRGMCSPLGFSWRLLRNAMIAWAAALLLLGAAYGSVAGQSSVYSEGNGMMAQMINNMGGYESLVVTIMGLLISVPLIVAMNKLRSEERRGRIEQVLSKAVSRGSAFLSYLCIAVLASLLFPFLLVIGFYAVGASSAPAGTLDLAALLKASYAYLPAQLCMIGLSAFLVGCFPKLTSLSWVMFAYSFLVVYFGGMFQVPEAMKKISPFGNVPQLLIQGQELKALPLVILCVIAAALMAAGLIGYRRRDILGT